MWTWNEVATQNWTEIDDISYFVKLTMFSIR